MQELIIDKKVFKPYDSMYYVSADGDVYSTYSHKLLKHYIDHNGYHRVDLHGEHKKIHILVYTIWVGPIPKEKQVNHKDGNKDNNHYSNLYVGTQRENILDKIKNKHNVGHMYYLTIFDKEKNKTMTFCPAKEFIDYCHHSNKSGSLNKYFQKNWFKKRYEIIEYKRIENIDLLNSMEGVSTMGDECSPVGQSLSLSQAHRVDKSTKR